MYKHILFDNDGTIVDSEILAVRGMLQHFSLHGLDIDEALYSSKYPGLLDRDIVAMVQKEYQITFPVDFLERLHATHNDLFDTQLAVIEGMDHLFKAIRVPKSMVSNGSVRHVDRCLRKVGLFEYLDGQIFSAEQVANPKPHPDVYLHALHTLHLQPHEVIAVEDSPTGISSAKAAGLQVIGFTGAAHIGPGHADILKGLGADYIAVNAFEVRQIMERLQVAFAHA